MGDSRVKDVSSLLSSFFNEDKLQRGELYSSFFASWSSIVGARLAAHSHVADVEKGMLIVEAEHPGWIQLLQLKQSDILQAVARRFPDLGLRGIAFRLSGRVGATADSIRPAGTIALENEHEPTEQDIKDMAAQATVVEEIIDPGFKAMMRSLKDSLQGKP